LPTAHSSTTPTRNSRVHHRELINFLTTASAADKHRPTRTHPMLQGELANTIRDTLDLFDNLSAEEAAQFILWHDLWLDFGTYGVKRRSERTPGFSFNRWDRGQIISVDFGLNIGKEFSFMHPAIVVTNFYDFVIVVPLTGDEGPIPKTYPKDIDGAMLRVKKTDPRLIDKTTGLQIQLNKDSIAMVPHVRCISKNRIRNNTGINIANTPFFEEIQDTLYRYLCSDLVKKHELNVKELEAQIETLKQEHEKDLETLRAKMEETIMELKAQVNALTGREAAPATE
jgi:mRNA-degrading endonuclease toxin of MazEF toxin-antitoxin module